jgi:hypothetical protein
LNDRQVEAAKDAAGACGAEASLTSVYLATTIKKSGSSTGIPYSIVAGIDDAMPFGGLSAGCDGVILNAWAADALQARLGDKIELEYLVPRPDGSYSNKKTVLKLIGIAEMSGAALDRGLVPSFQGITDAGRIDEWNPPFPVDMDRITPRDEAYWDKYRTTPKAFVSLDVLRRMWASNYPGQMGGWVTSVRIHPQSDESLAALDTRFTTELMKHLKPEDSGLVFRPIRRMALASSTGTTDFGQLFLGMSIFLVAAGAGLAGMLMRLSADRRAAEAGIMLASGFSPKTTV